MRGVGTRNRYGVRQSDSADGFTIVSISLSLIAVLIPVLLMGGIVWRLFREFALTLALTIVLSAFVSLTLTPMLASRFVRAVPDEKRGWFHRAGRRSSSG